MSYDFPVNFSQLLQLYAAKNASSETRVYFRL